MKLSIKNSVVTLLAGAAIALGSYTAKADAPAAGTIPPDQTNMVYMPVVTQNTTVDTYAAITSITKLTSGYSISFKTDDLTYRGRIKTEKDAQNLGLLIGKTVRLRGTPLRYTKTGATLSDFDLPDAANKAQFNIQICHYTDQTGCTLDGATQDVTWYEDGSVMISYSDMKIGLCVTPDLGCTDSDNKFEYEKLAEGRYNVYTGR